MGVVNLESICARYGMMLADSGQDKMTDKENIVTKALGVLVQNGIYAMTVFLMTCNKPKYGENVLRTLAALLADKGVGLLPDRQWQDRDGLVELLQTMREITEELPRLLLARKMLEGTLTFARYHCKALNRLNGEAS